MGIRISNDNLVALVSHCIESNRTDDNVNHPAGYRKIAAIRLLREVTGLGLKDAKELVDADIASRAPPPPNMREFIEKRFGYDSDTIAPRPDVDTAYRGIDFDYDTLDD